MVPRTRAARWPRRHAARLRAIEVLVNGRQTIGDDVVLGTTLGHLLRKHAEVRWISAGAAALRPNAPERSVEIDHVVPVHVLVDRIISGDDVAAVLSAGGQCLVTRDEHNGAEGLARFRLRHKDLAAKMRTCDLDDLIDLGWERYRRAGIEWGPLDGAS